MVGGVPPMAGRRPEPRDLCRLWRHPPPLAGWQSGLLRQKVGWSRIRTYEGRSHLIYSQVHLTALVSTLIDNLHGSAQFFYLLSLFLFLVQPGIQARRFLEKLGGWSRESRLGRDDLLLTPPPSPLRSPRPELGAEGGLRRTSMELPRLPSP